MQVQELPAETLHRLPAVPVVSAEQGDQAGKTRPIACIVARRDLGLGLFAALGAPTLMEQEVPHDELDLWQLHLLVAIIGSLVLEICAPAFALIRQNVVLFRRFKQLLAMALMPVLATPLLAGRRLVLASRSFIWRIPGRRLIGGAGIFIQFRL